MIFFFSASYYLTRLPPFRYRHQGVRQRSVKYQASLSLMLDGGPTDILLNNGTTFSDRRTHMCRADNMQNGDHQLVGYMRRQTGRVFVLDRLECVALAPLHPKNNTLITLSLPELRFRLEVFLTFLVTGQLRRTYLYRRSL